MAARPLLHVLDKQIQAAGGDDYIMDQVASNIPVRKIVQEFVNPETGKPFSRGMLWYWKKMNPERVEAWAEARRVAAHNMMEDAAEDLDKAEKGILTPADVRLLDSKVKFRQYLAERYNREEYGQRDPEAEGVNVNLSLGDAFLVALRHHGNAHQLNPPPQEALPAEIVEDDDDGDDAFAELLA